ncbi:hypothetical protein O181_028091 [Austropuccinia psidii MF-1]|uniref:Integrase catalytic domain-containing protein n=1 Tax=Austropuccinia psidii MF-1 TaxID=1389203 RepID=A0A9Q3CTS5_9BASI|nr:hypothetical protein [Austropuccinia psidii MF-1]
MNDKTLDIKDISTIPILDGTNYGHWQMRMKIYLRSRDLLDVCKNLRSNDTSTSSINKWKKASFEAINLITTRITERVFREVVNSETIENSHLIWAKISKHYASKCAVNRWRVWMDWQRCFYDGNLQNYIDNCCKLMMELDAVSIVVPNKLLSYSLLGKLGGNSQLNQFVETLTFKEDIIEKPMIILSWLQDFASHINHSNSSISKKEHDSSALITSFPEPHKIIFYCSNGKHNKRCTTHKKEDCWAENPHLRPSRLEKKRKNNPAAHLSIAQALTTLGGSSVPAHNQVVVDCGATHHMFNSPKFFLNCFKKICSKVATGDSNSKLWAQGIGTVQLECEGQLLNLRNCLYVPKLKCNLISLLELFKEDLTIQQTGNTFRLISNKRTLLKGDINNRLMHITYSLPTSLLTISDKSLWHCQLGHPSRTVLKYLGLPEEETSCLTCRINKSHRLPFTHHFTSVNSPMDTIHIDVVGPITPESVSGFRFLLTIVDQATSFKIIKFLKRKSDSFDQFVIAKTHMENWHNRKIRKLVSDRGGEFLNQRFEALANECGFVHIFAPPETPEHNGFSERANRTILEKARCLMSPTNLPNRYWAEAINTAVFLSNLSPTLSRDGKSPQFLWSSISPNLTGLRTFGCFENEGSAYRILRLDDLKVVITRNAVFNKRVFPSIPGKTTSVHWTIDGIDESLPLAATYSDRQIEGDSLSNSEDNVDILNHRGSNDESIINSERTNEDQTDESPNESSSNSPIEHGDLLNNERHRCSSEEATNNHKTRRVKVVGPRHPTLITSNVDSIHILPYSQRAKALLTTTDNAPKTYHKAIQGENKVEWESAIQKELLTMKKLEVWDVIELRSDYKLVGTTWVFKIKKDHLNHALEHKARLCAQGFTQTPGIDFEKTYAPTGRLNSLRALIAHASFSGLDFHQIDVKSAFLNAPLMETVYLTIPQGLDIDRRKFCLKLNKAIYGLKQAPLAWYTRLKDWLQSVGFLVCKLDP